MDIRLIIGISISLFLLGCQPNHNTSKDKETSAISHKRTGSVEVYTTAKNTALRLTQTESAGFLTACPTF